MPALTPLFVAAARQAMERGHLTPAHVRRRGGPGETTLARVLAGEGPTTCLTVTKLERALGWERGTGLYLLGRPELQEVAASQPRGLRDRRPTTAGPRRRRRRGVTDRGK